MAKRLTDNMHGVGEIIRLYRITHAQVLAELAKAKSEVSFNRSQQILKGIDGIIKKAATDTRIMLGKTVPAAYGAGADQAVRQLRAANAPIRVAAGFNVIHQEAMRTLTERSFFDYARGLTALKGQARAAIGDAQRLIIRDKLAISSIAGESLKKTASEVKDVLQSHGAVALLDRGGKRWQLDSYATMLSRTKHREIFNKGTTNRAVENGYDLVQISNHNADDSCAEWEGEIISLTGKTPGYPTMAEVEASDTHMFGPNCRHTYAIYVPALARRTSAFRPGIDDVDDEGRFQ